jgi:hypothetical protein
MFSFKKLVILFALLVAATPLIARAAYVPTSRDTQPEPPVLSDIPLGAFDGSGYATLHENANFVFYWKETYDILAVYDKRIGYLWKSGLDVNPEFTRASQNTICNNAKRNYNNDTITFEEFEDLCAVKVNHITGTTTGPLQANSLLYFSYYSKGASDSVFSTTNVYSSYLRTLLYTVNSTMQMRDGDDTTWRFTMAASKLGVETNLDLTIEADLTFSEEGFRISIPDVQVNGTAKPYLSSIGIAPYLGAVGGEFAEYSVTPKEGETFGDWERLDEVPATMINGYAFVPDGPGALIRFRNNSVSLSRYAGYVYGDDPSQSEQNYRVTAGTYVPFKTASIPVFGIAHGVDQAAFVAYATSGSEYMTIISTPEENSYKYNNTHGNFSYNFKYNKLFTLDGDNPVPSIYPETNKLDIAMNFDFLAGDGTTDDLPANYFGMAKKYKAHLLENGTLTLSPSTATDIGIRLDFLMADVENSIVGLTTKVATTANGVRRILDDVLAKGISNISAGLIGWQRGGVTAGSPIRAEFDAKIGSKSAYERLIDEFAEQNIDISFYQDYYNINEEQMTLLRNAAKHPAGWYARVNTWEDPVGSFYFSRPIKAVEWLNRQTTTFAAMGVRSFTVDGISNRLITDYTDGVFSRTDAIALFESAFSALNQQGKINAVKPNDFLLKYVDRYLLMDVFTSQFLIMTDTVPFLQILLHGTMELYAIYANFSFYTASDMLRMIDYNVYPSFVLTEEPSYLLTHTNSSDYYSTEYSVYAEQIVTLYDTVNGALKHVIGAAWIGRELLAPGIVQNTYSNGVVIVINYTDTVYDTVLPVSAQVRGGE